MTTRPPGAGLQRARVTDSWRIITQREEKALVRDWGDWSENQQASQSRVGSQNPEETFAEKSCQIKKRKTKLKCLRKPVSEQW